MHLVQHAQPGYIAPCCGTMPKLARLPQKADTNNNITNFFAKKSAVSEKTDICEPTMESKEIETNTNNGNLHEHDANLHGNEDSPDRDGDTLTVLLYYILYILLFNNKTSSFPIVLIFKCTC